MKEKALGSQGAAPSVPKRRFGGSLNRRSKDEISQHGRSHYAQGRGHRMGSAARATKAGVHQRQPGYGEGNQDNEYEAKPKGEELC